jgi:hypothetical protein
MSFIDFYKALEKAIIMMKMPGLIEDDSDIEDSDTEDSDIEDNDIEDDKQNIKED